jgi:hypothetical protein
MDEWYDFYNPTWEDVGSSYNLGYNVPSYDFYNPQPTDVYNTYNLGYPTESEFPANANWPTAQDLETARLQSQGWTRDAQGNWTSPGLSYGGTSSGLFSGLSNLLGGGGQSSGGLLNTLFSKEATPWWALLAGLGAAATEKPSETKLTQTTTKQPTLLPEAQAAATAYGNLLPTLVSQYTSPNVPAEQQALYNQLWGNLGNILIADQARQALTSGLGELTLSPDQIQDLMQEQYAKYGTRYAYDQGPIMKEVRDAVIKANQNLAAQRAAYQANMAQQLANLGPQSLATYQALLGLKTPEQQAQTTALSQLGQVAPYLFGLPTGTTQQLGQTTTGSQQSLLNRLLTTLGSGLTAMI